MMKVFAVLAPVSVADVTLATFDGAEQTTSTWVVKNDPVMGGGSSSNFTTTADSTAYFQGTCRIVTFLNAPGFAKVIGSKNYGDVTGTNAFALKVRSTTPEYKGFKLAWSATDVPTVGPQFGPKVDGSYKADFSITGTDWQVVEVPFTMFSYDWSQYTGTCNFKDPDTDYGAGLQHYCCPESGLTPSKAEVCVDSKYLNVVKTLEIWAEGAEGDFNIEIESITAVSTSVQV